MRDDILIKKQGNNKNRAYWERKAQSDLSIILKQRDEIGKLKYTVQRLRQKRPICDCGKLFKEASQP